MELYPHGFNRSTLVVSRHGRELLVWQFITVHSSGAQVFHARLGLPSPPPLADAHSEKKWEREARDAASEWHPAGNMEDGSQGTHRTSVQPKNKP